MAADLVAADLLAVVADLLSVEVAEAETPTTLLITGLTPRNPKWEDCMTPAAERKPGPVENRNWIGPDWTIQMLLSFHCQRRRAQAAQMQLSDTLSALKASSRVEKRSTKKEEILMTFVNNFTITSKNTESTLSPAVSHQTTPIQL